MKEVLQEDELVLIIESIMPTVTSIVVNFSDGTTQTVSAAPVVAPTDTEVDVLLSDGTTKKFVPAPAA